VHIEMIFGRVKGVWVGCQKTLVHLKMILVVIKDVGGHKNDFGWCDERVKCTLKWFWEE